MREKCKKYEKSLPLRRREEPGATCRHFFAQSILRPATLPCTRRIRVRTGSRTTREMAPRAKFHFKKILAIFLHPFVDRINVFASRRGWRTSDV